MERFLKRYADRIVGSIAGFDRLLFRGSLLSICYRDGMDRFLSSQGVLYKDWGAFVQRLSAALRVRAEAMAQRAGRPFLYVGSSKASKEEMVQALVEQDHIEQGLVCVLSCVEPCWTFSIRRDRPSKMLQLVAEERKCLHLYFYYVDREFGLMHIRLQTWLPMTIQVCVNGREWLARQMDQAGIAYEKKDNCFTAIADLPRAQALMDSLVERRWENVLNAWARRVNPWLEADAQPCFRPYYWTVRQGEFATDILFRSPQDLAEIYPALVRQAIEQFDAGKVLRFLGRRTNARFAGEVHSHLERRLEGICVKHFAEENWIKMYDKYGRLLRIEMTINNPRRFMVRRRGTRRGRGVVKWLPLRKGIADFKRRAELGRAANERYLQALAVVGEPRPSHRILDPVSRPVETPQRRYRALRPISPEDSRLFAVIQRGEFNLQGVRNQDLRQHLYPEIGDDPVQRRFVAARLTRQLRLLQAHGLIYRVHKTYYYRVTAKGQEVMTTALKFRQTDLALLAV